MESKSRRAPRLAAPVENRPLAASRAAPRPASSQPEPPAAPQSPQVPQESPPALQSVQAEPEAPVAGQSAESQPESPAAPQPAPSYDAARAGSDGEAAALSPPLTAVSPPAPVSASPAPAIAVEAGDDMLAAIAQSRAALARGLESIGDEVASFARHSLDASAQAAIQLLGAKTWADAFAVNSSLARTSFDSWLGSSAKVSELGIKLAIDWSKPLASGLGKVLERG
jgi:hypothetical protein